MRTMSLACFIFVLLISSTFAYKQTFAATGTLYCQGKPAPGQQVQMKITDRLMKGKVASTVRTATNGLFKIQGSENSQERKSAYLWIEHKCDPKRRAGCTVMTYISIGKENGGKQINVGKLELSKNIYYNSCDDNDN